MDDWNCFDFRARSPLSACGRVQLGLSFKERYLQKADECGRALHDSHHVMALGVTLDMYRCAGDTADYDEEDYYGEDYNRSVYQEDTKGGPLMLLQWISTSPSLEELFFCGNEKGPSISEELMPWFLRAVANRRFFPVQPLRVLKIYNVDLTCDQLLELGKSNELEHFVLENCNALGSNTFTTRVLVRSSFAKCGNLKLLHLGWTRDNADVINGFLSSVQSLPKLQELGISCSLRSGSYRHRLLPESVQEILRSLFQTGTCPLRTLTFKRIRWTPATLSALIQSIQASPMKIERIGFVCCQFVEQSFNLLHGLFDGTSSVKCLALTTGERQKDYYEDFHDLDREELSNLVATAKGLNEIVVQENASRVVRSVLEGLALKTCSVQGLTIESYVDTKALLDRLPHCHSLKDVKFSLSDRKLNDKLVRAFKNNASLLTATIEGGFVRPREEELIQSYLTRNAKLPELFEATAALSEAHVLLFPRLLRASSDSTRAAHGSLHLFSALLKLEDHNGPDSPVELDDGENAPRKRLKMK